MTNRALIDYCYVIAGVCKSCKRKKECNDFKAIFGNDPYEADEVHPEQYNSEEIVDVSENRSEGNW